MSISYPLSLPAGLSFSNITIAPENAVGVTESPYSFKQQIYDYNAQRWTLQAQYQPLTKVQAGLVKAFLLSLKGPVGTFYAGDFLAAVPMGTVSGTVLVKGASQVGQSLLIDGLPASLSNAFRAGDQIQIGNYLYSILNTVNSNGSGECTLDIWPALRSSPADNAVVTYSNPKSIWRLDSASVGWSASEVGMYDISFTAVEAI